MPATKGKTSTGKPSTGKAEPILGTKVGVVRSDVRDKTRQVVVPFKVMHAKYGKYVSRRTVLHVHDETNESHMGDTVEVAPCRRLSKTKSWKIVRIVSRGQVIEEIAS